MIVSHEHQFIFVHLKRTAGRSLTAELARHLGPDDIVTPITAPAGRPHLGVEGRNCGGLRRHATAAQIRAHVGPEVWQRYFKFTFERNPWDKVLSRYWSWRNRSGRTWSFRRWFALKTAKGYLVQLGRVGFPQEFESYTENGRLCLDFVGRFEQRDEHLRQIGQRLGLDLSGGADIGAHGRRDRRPYAEHYTPWMRAVVERVYAREIELLGYRFGQPDPTEPLLLEHDGAAAGA